ncbi:hypothetical protein IFVP22_C210409 [Vibrio parahaemolyticus]
MPPTLSQIAQKHNEPIPLNLTYKRKIAFLGVSHGWKVIGDTAFVRLCLDDTRLSCAHSILAASQCSVFRA